jgi:sporulation-control protein spo0M
MKVYHNVKQTMVESNIWGAFQVLGFEFEFDTTSGPYRLLFDEEKLSERARLRELWSIDFPLDQSCCQLKGLLLDLVELISQSKITWFNHVYRGVKKFV